MLRLLSAATWSELASALAGNAAQLATWKPLLTASAAAWGSLPAERLWLFRCVRLPGADLSEHKELLDRLSAGWPVTWGMAVHGSLDHHVAMAGVDRGESGVAIVFKIHAVTARKINGFSWMAGEDGESSVLKEVLLAPGTLFESTGLYECTDQALRKGVPLETTRRGSSFSVVDESKLVQLPPDQVLKRRQIMVCLEEVVQT